MARGLASSQVSRQNRSLVVAMTIAEVFLLLMFVVWLGSVVANEGAGSPLKSVELEERLESLEKKYDALIVDYGKAMDTNEALRVMLGAPTLGPEGLKAALEKELRDAAEAAKRGKPACVGEDNVMLDVLAA